MALPRGQHERARSRSFPPRLARSARWGRAPRHSAAGDRPSPRDGGGGEPPRRPAGQPVSAARRASGHHRLGPRVEPDLDGGGPRHHAGAPRRPFPAGRRPAAPLARTRLRPRAGGRPPGGPRHPEAPAGPDPERARQRPLHLGGFDDLPGPGDRRAERRHPALPDQRSGQDRCAGPTPAYRQLLPQGRSPGSGP
jgi:hypothetical protein